ncbi:hypothetical protein [Rathayibacter sp. AY2B5]|uniref:hypothetical protein n=1 Tax=Rathayibacter sp. AY2B5 TaxID=2080570 RepID=UPI000CE8F344|nr:hypothetical protein [Rathayibacter sp. AY2B5]PPG43968.1 hypothetical protein C5C30_03185 [Rathayibacter sp. AY2B5]
MTSGVEAGVHRDDDRTVLHRRWFAVVASLIFAFGWLLIPGVGWLIGAVAVLCSSAWTRSEKGSALAIPLVAAALVGSGVGLFYGLLGAPSSSLTTWTVVGAGMLAGGAATALLGVRLCARALRRPEESAGGSLSPAAPASGAYDVS